VPYGAGTVTVLDSNVIWPVSQSNLPSTTESVPTEFETTAKTLPLKLAFEPMVEEAATAQNTLAALAPLIKRT